MRYGIDIDGVLCEKTTPDKYHEATPCFHRIHHVNRLYDAGHRIYLYTGRHMDKEPVTKKWLNKYNVQYHHIFFGKPVCDVYVDDLMISLQEFDEE